MTTPNADYERIMTVGRLRDILADLPADMPIAVHANNHTYAAGADSFSHGRCRVAILHHYAGEHVLIGNPFTKDINPPNWFITRWLDGAAQIDSSGAQS